jgi:Putative lumazine-binding
MHPRSLLFVAVLLWVCACTPPAPTHPEEAELRPFIEKYFSTWSTQDMQAYEGCFHPSAKVTYVAKTGQIQSLALSDFIHDQTMSHRFSKERSIEVPTNIRLTGDATVVQAQVKWKLTVGPKITTGMDYFTLIKTENGWRIAALVFNSDS